ncbi:MAG: ABC transporter ATP-binding protein [Betaproteobacteria bacterium]|nr:ABC transporter ATP-binding protein [Betaproteobacteria bacterium]
MSSLRLINIDKSFGKTAVLKNINLEVEEGEFVVFVGPSGCGKSTMLRIIAGLEDATSGTIEIADQVVNDVPPAKRGIGMVFQSYALFPHLNVRDNLALGLKQSKEDKQLIDERVKESSRILHLDPYLERFPAQLSGGQRQRVAIGRAIARHPKLFLFDEPLSNLDAALRMSTRVEIANLHRQIDTTMIYVTHDQIEAMTLADRIVVLRDGVVEQVGTPMELYNNPVNQFVAGFLGLPSMNFLPAEQIGSKQGATAGIRPEHLVFGESGPIDATVVYVEQLGGDTNVIVKLAAGAELTARLFGQHKYSVGDKVKVAVDEDNIYLFDADGKRIR